MEAGTLGIERNRIANIRRVLDSLVVEREKLRRSGADRALLAASGLAIEYWQRELWDSSQTARAATHVRSEPSNVVDPNL